MLRRPSLIPLLIAGLLASASAAPDPADASDFSDTCTSTDGAYVMDAEMLYAAADWRKGDTSKPITYTKGRETVHAREAGNCIDFKRGGGKPIGYESKRYVLMVTIQKDGRPRQIELRCQLYADGQPAAFSCDRRTVTQRVGHPERDEKGWGIEQGSTGEKPPALSSWTHNGSAMQLAAQGEGRTFTYVAPRTGLEANGIHPGTVPFDGTSDGRTYKGRARFFSKACGEITFSVQGAIEQNGARVRLEGAAPKLSAACRPTGATTPQTLVFKLKPKG